MIAERAVMARLEAGCHAPVGALARVEGAELHVEAVVAALDGSRLVRHGISSGVRPAHTPTDRPAALDPAARWTDGPAAAVGTALAERLLEMGAASLMGATA